jgi:hypothetical protein
MNVATTAAAYQLTRQGLHALRHRHGLSMDAFRDPDKVLAILLEDSRRGKTRSLLLDPATRNTIRKQLTP